MKCVRCGIESGAEQCCVECAEDLKRKALQLAELRSAAEHREWIQRIHHPQMLRATVIAPLLAMLDLESADRHACINAALVIADEILAGRKGNGTP